MTKRHQTQTLALDALARAAVALGARQRAARLLQDADGLHDRIQHALDDADRADATAARAYLHAQPGTDDDHSSSASI